MQDILLEPYGGKILKLPVGATTALTAMLALGGGIGLWIAARRLNHGADPHRVAGFGALVGVIAFAFVMFAAPLESGEIFGIGVGLIGLRRRPVRAWHADGFDGGGAPGGPWPRARRLGRGAGDRRRPRHRRQSASSTTGRARSRRTAPSAMRSPIRSPASRWSMRIEILLLLATIVAIGPLARRIRNPADLARLAASSPIGFNPGGSAMIRGAIGHLDVAQIVLYAFFAFFAGPALVSCAQEDRREGYPLESETPMRLQAARPWLFIPSPKTFRLADGSMVTAPTLLETTRDPSTPPRSNPGPARRSNRLAIRCLLASAPAPGTVRPDVPYKTADGHDLVAPLRVATNFAVAADGGNPLGFTVIGGDRKAAGTIKDLWVDRAESLLRYYEIALTSGKSVLVPVHFADVNFRTRTITINALTAQPVRQWSPR